MKTGYRILFWICIIAAGAGCTGLWRGPADGPPDDVSITRIIKREIDSDPELKGQRITVVSRGGQVVLSGSVQRRSQESRIIKFALRVKGVRSVKDDITVLKK